LRYRLDKLLRLTPSQYQYPIKERARTHVDERKVRDQGFYLTDDLGLRCGVKGLKFQIEDSLLLRFLLLGLVLSMHTPSLWVISHLCCCFFDWSGGGGRGG
jgi:hypothetical protein